VRRPLFAVLSAVAVLFGTTVVSAPSASASSGYCPTAKGVTVVVDFRALGGDVQVSCDSGATSSTSGLSALHGAGFSTAGTAHDGEGFVCRINDQPTKSAERCLNTPPTTAYWSYWYAPNGGSWTYSNKGAANRDVIVGGFEGWSFHKGSGATNQPDAKATRPPPPAVPTYKLGPAASAKAKASASSSSTSSSSSTRTTSKPSATATATGSAAATDPPTTPDGTSTSADVQAAGPELPGDGPPGGGTSPWPFVGALVAIALIGGGAWLVVRQRRRMGGA
jgi:hypothetical protein